MPIHSFRPLTPSGRFTQLNKQPTLSKKRPQKALTESKHKSGGRNVYGRVTSRHRGGGHKQLYRIIDFKRDVLDMPAKVQAIEYDPGRSANIALVAYTDGVKKYIIAPKGLKAGDTIFASNKATTNDFNVGNSFPLSIIPPSTLVHCVELVPGRGVEASAQKAVAGLQHLVEWAAPPALGRLDILGLGARRSERIGAGAAIFDQRRLGGAMAPANQATLVDGVQRVN